MPMPSSIVRVELGSRAYSIVVGSGLLESPASFRDLPRASSCVIVSNETVGPLYSSRLADALDGIFAKIDTLLVPDGEAHKDWPTLQRIFDGLIEAHCDRDTVIFALGGGVVGDLAGFAASCYMRGVAYVQVPTTLLAQVDSSVGGKTAINHSRGKNLIGAFHQPSAVIADVDTLDTLAQNELVAGLAEVIKYGAVADDAFLAWIEANLARLLARDKPALIEAVTRSCRIKAAVVAADERESGLRAILNFGHTFAHAIETGTGHGTWLHGEAVGCGMVMAADLSVRLGLIGQGHANRLAALIGAAGLPMRAPRLGIDRYLELMSLDKKSQAGRLRFVVLEGAGKAALRVVDARAVAPTLELFCA
ncbi:MAG TPA: 3-dehydroquinate synthase [Caldimonas sp.]